MYDTKEAFEGASVGIVEYRGRHGRTRQPAGDRIYLVLKGEGKFLFGNERRDDELVPVTKYDVVLIPKDTTYDYPGRMRIFLVRVPTNEQDSDVHLDDLWE